eukprot:3974144-Pleurochrysis_carterae.AAC.1
MSSLCAACCMLLACLDDSSSKSTDVTGSSSRIAEKRRCEADVMRSDDEAADSDARTAFALPSGP